MQLTAEKKLVLHKKIEWLRDQLANDELLNCPETLYHLQGELDYYQKEYLKIEQHEYFSSLEKTILANGVSITGEQ
jgi:hypothetical protein